MNLGLTAEFQSQLDALVAACARRGVVMKPYFGLRDPIAQAKLWRQSRSAAQILAEKQKLVGAGATFLAKCIDDAGPQNGPWATNAPPGLSWHQFGIACDCVWLVDGKEEWSNTVGGDANGYKIYAQEAFTLRLTTLGSVGDDDHVQQPKAASPLSLYCLSEVSRIMEAKFSPL